MNFSFRILVINICILFAAIHLCKGQTISIKIRDAEKNPLAGATVQLTKVVDSTKVYNATDKTGIVRFEGVSNALYVIKMSYVGYQTLEKTVNVKSNQSDFEFQLKKDIITLGEVSVSAERPLIRQEDDKMIIDPLPMINTSTNTLEVLEKTPGLYVDQDGGIYLSSTSAAAVYINGREQKMSTQDIANLLRSLPPGSVEKIEVMRTPSTKYDAASSGGIINVILKKGVKLGRFGSVNAGMNQGFYGNQFGGFSFNGSGDKSTYYLNMNYSHNDKLETLNSNRTLMADTFLNQSARIRQNSHQGYLGYGISHEANEKWTLTYDGRANLSFPRSYTQNNNLINAVDESLLSQNDNNINNRFDFLNVQQDFGGIKKFDTLGSNLDTKLSYNYNYNKEKQDYLYEYTFPIHLQIEGNGENKQERHFILFQSDLTYFFPKKIKLEAGIKSTYQNYDSRTDFFINQNGIQESDLQRTNSFNYRESINAVYAQASKTFGKNLILKTGMRIEHTYMNGHQTIPSDTSFLINRVDWFPYIYLSKTIIKMFDTDIKGYLIYRRTISRPGYQSLNPYIKFVDQFLYETGNPALKPQFTDNIEVNISFDDMPLLAIGQNYTRDIFSSVVYQDSTHESVAVRTYDNLGKNRETYIRVMGGIPPGKRYFFAIGGQYNFNEYNGFYENEPFTYKRGSWRLFTFQSLRLFKQTKLTVSGFMMIKGQYNFYELKNFGQLNIGLSQTLFKGKLTISLSARDVLRTMVTKFQIDQGSIQSTGDRYTDDQRFGINIRYNFGMKKKEGKRDVMQFEQEEQ
jgi:iron complex outermembrane recepter protein